MIKRDGYEFSKILRDVLIEHLDGKPIKFSLPHSVRRHAARILINRKLLKGDRTFQPYHTVITDKGRAELAKMLADYADALFRVGYGDPANDVTVNGGAFLGEPEIEKREVSGRFGKVQALSLGWIAKDEESGNVFDDEIGC